MDQFELISQVVNWQVMEMCANAGMITLGELEARLSALHEDAEVRFDRVDMGYPNNLYSYRGYYHHIAIEPSNKPITVGELLWQVRGALDGHTFTGWKGGEFTMTRMTPVWVSYRGESSGVGLIGVSTWNHEVVLRTKVVE